MPLETSFVAANAAAEEINAFCILIIAIYDEILRSYVSRVANYSLSCSFSIFRMGEFKNRLLFYNIKFFLQPN